MIIRNVLAATALLVSLEASAAEVIRVGPYAFHSSLWINLHETLMHCATTKTPCDFAGLSPDERAAWDEAVQTYRRTWRDEGGSITFVRPMRITHDVLTSVADEETAPELREPLGPALVKAAPIYRRHLWEADDRANRFWIDYASAIVADAGPELADAHARAYARPWPESVRVDASAHAVPFGAYTMMGKLAGVHATIAARDSGNRCLSALETIVHETSHALVGPRHGPIAEAIRKHAERLGIEPPRDLWHAILFATSSELTRRALESRGVADFVPSVHDLYRRVWPLYEKPVQTFWIGYLDGELTMDEAIGRIVEAAPRPR